MAYLWPMFKEVTPGGLSRTTHPVMTTCKWALAGKVLGNRGSFAISLWEASGGKSWGKEVVAARTWLEDKTVDQ